MEADCRTSWSAMLCHREFRPRISDSRRQSVALGESEMFAVGLVDAGPAAEISVFS